MEKKKKVILCALIVVIFVSSFIYVSFQKPIGEEELEEITSSLVSPSPEETINWENVTWVRVRSDLYLGQGAVIKDCSEVGYFYSGWDSRSWGSIYIFSEGKYNLTFENVTYKVESGGVVKIWK